MATIKGKWVFKNKVSFTENLTEKVNFNILTVNNDYSSQCVKMVFDLNSVYGEDSSSYVDSMVNGGVASTYTALVDFGDTPQTVSEEFFQLMNKTALCTTVKGRYIVDTRDLLDIPRVEGINTYGPPTLFYVNYTDLDGNIYDSFASYYYNDTYADLVRVYFTKGSSYNAYVGPSTGFTISASACKVLDFGETEQTIDYKFFYHVLRYMLVPIEDNQFVDSIGLATIVDRLTTRYKSDILSAANAALPGMTSIYKYGSTAVTTYTINSCTYDALFLCVTPSSSSTQIFMTIPVKSVEKGATIQFDAPDNTMTTRFSVYRATSNNVTINTVACYNQNAASQNTTGTINAIYGMKVGG